MNVRAHDLAVALSGVLGSLGPGARGVSYHACLTWVSYEVLTSTDDAVRALAVDLDLGEPAIERVGAIWWTQAEAQDGRLRVVVRGPNHEGRMPTEPP